MNSRMLFVLAAIVALTTCAAAAANRGPHYEEDDDAGSLPGDSKKLVGDGALLTINGALTGGSRGGGDYQDMYQVYIAQPGEFQLRVLGASAGFNTQLFLFDEDGRGMLANNDSIIDGQESILSTLPNQSDDGTNVVVQKPGLYYIAISGYSSLPVNQNGHLFFFNPETPFEVSGPDGQGGFSPIAAWDHPGDTGGYVISLSGVEFIPSEFGIGACCIGQECLGDVTEHECTDFGGIFQGYDTTCEEVVCDEGGNVPGDVTGDGHVNIHDLLLVIADWNCQGDDCVADANNDGHTNVLDLLVVLENWGT